MTRRLAHHGVEVPDPTCPSFCWEPICSLNRGNTPEVLGLEVDHTSQPRHTLVPAAHADHRLEVTITTVDEIDLETRQWVRREPEAWLNLQDATDWQDRCPAWESYEGVCLNADDLTAHIAGLTAVRDELLRLSVPGQRA